MKKKTRKKGRKTVIITRGVITFPKGTKPGRYVIDLKTMTAKRVGS